MDYIENGRDRGVIATVLDKESVLHRRVENRRAIGRRVDDVLRRASTEANDENYGHSTTRHAGGMCGLVACMQRVFRGRSPVPTVAISAAQNGVAMNGSSTQSATGISFFGTRRSAAAEQDVAVGKLSTASRQIMERATLMRERAESSRTAARGCAERKQRAQALTHLRRAKAQEAQADKLESASVAVQHQSDVLEEASLHVEVAKALGETQKTLKRSQKAITKCESAVDDAAELRDMNDEMHGVLAQLGDSSSATIDDDDLMAELDEMMAPDRPAVAESAIAVAVGTACDGKGGVASVATVSAQCNPDAYPSVPDTNGTEARSERTGLLHAQG
jgi:hypothetical protein